MDNNLPIILVYERRIILFITAPHPPHPRHYSVLNKINPVHTIPTYFCEIHFNIIQTAMPNSTKCLLHRMFFHPKLCVNYCFLPRMLHAPFVYTPSLQHCRNAREE